MQLYKCHVRLNGSLLNAVAKHDVTAAEIVLLRHIHGQSENANDPVINIVPTTTVKRSDSTERARLASMYRLGEKNGPELVAELLGVAGVPLPQYVPGIDEPEQEAVDEPAPKRTRITRAKGAGGKFVPTTTEPEAPAEPAFAG